MLKVWEVSCTGIHSINTWCIEHEQEPVVGNETKENEEKPQENEEKPKSEECTKVDNEDGAQLSHPNDSGDDGPGQEGILGKRSPILEESEAEKQEKPEKPTPSWENAILEGDLDLLPLGNEGIDERHIVGTSAKFPVVNV